MHEISPATHFLVELASHGNHKVTKGMEAGAARRYPGQPSRRGACSKLGREEFVTVHGHFRQPAAVAAKPSNTACNQVSGALATVTGLVAIFRDSSSYRAIQYLGDGDRATTFINKITA